MATILLQAAGGLAGGLMGGPLGAVLGRAAGGLAGSAIDGALFGETRHVEGPRLDQTPVMRADEGAGVPRVYGTIRVTGQMIWATRFEESASTQRSGGKGRQPAVETTSYRYFGNFAVGLCEGPIAAVRRIWADGDELDLEALEVRLHHGTESQGPDPLIEARQGTGNAPAYRGLTYLVFERLPLARWGNRLPQISAEVIRPVGRLEPAVRAITIIPGASEHGLDPLAVRERLGPGFDRVVNRNVPRAPSDWHASIDELCAVSPALKRAALVSAWFGDDLRAGHCQIRPGVEVMQREETEPWRAGGCDRETARLISRHGGGPAYGGTPSEAGVLRAIADLKARGLAVTYYPFLLMDLPPGNGRPDPHGGTEQAAYPWRGRMTLDIAPGRAGTPERTAAARQQIEAFLGQARVEDFTVREGAIEYAGPEEWSYRRMILHQAMLARIAGVEAFIIGSEMRGLTQLRDETGAFVFVQGLIRLAEEVKTLLPNAVVTYAADWSEYFGHQPADESGDVFYHLDPLWASPAIGAIGIDNYLPLDDWRGGREDEPSAHDRNRLAAGIAAGEYYDWYYASAADRAARRRTPITDGSAGKPWVFRPKDIVSWWSHPHHERRGGVELPAPTAWVPRSKPVWLTELGCPAIDRGANQPNVFVDPKSSESYVPHFSEGGRDDLMQRRFLEAQLERLDPASPAFDPSLNPVSDLYGGPMLPPDAIHLWTWDARPYPAFPERSDLWSDGGNWRLGHWLNGRLGTAPLDGLVACLLADHGVVGAQAEALDEIVEGYMTVGPTSARRALEDLLRVSDGYATAAAGALRFASAARRSEAVPLEAFVETAGPYVERVRGDPSERAEEAAVGFLDPARAYQPGVAEAARAVPGAPRKVLLEGPFALNEESARRVARRYLDAMSADGATVRFALPLTMLGLEPGDLVELAGIAGTWRIEAIEDSDRLEVTARRVLASRPGHADFGVTTPVLPPTRPVYASRPEIEVLDLPLPEGGERFEGARIAAMARPFTGYQVEYRAAGGIFAQGPTIRRPATMGRLLDDMAPGGSGRFDHAGRIRVALHAGALSSVAAAEMFAGANLCAVRSRSGVWEVLQFHEAREIAAGAFEARVLLRGQGGTEDAASVGAAAGASFVLVDAAVLPLGLTAATAGAELQVRVVPLGREGDDPAAVETNLSVGLRGVRPLPPVHARATFAPAGDAEFRWIRRGRVAADAWEGEEIPLGEERELYDVELVAPGAAPAMLFEPTAPTLHVSAAAQVAHFGSLPARFDLCVRQKSPVHGTGGPLRARFERGRGFMIPAPAGA